RGTHDHPGRHALPHRHRARRTADRRRHQPDRRAFLPRPATQGPARRIDAAVIEAKDIHRRQGGLDGISLAIPPGIMTAIVGPNGAGKSTLLDLLAGRTRADSGAIAFGGIPIEDWSPLDLARQRAFLPQIPEVAFQVRVRDLVALGRSPYHG